LKKLWYLTVLVTCFLALSTVQAAFTQSMPYNGTKAHNGVLFDFTSTVNVSWDLTTGVYMGTSEPFKITPKNTWFTIYTLHRHYAVPLNNYRVQYKIRTEECSIILNRLWRAEDRFYQVWSSPGSQ
jgi:hypothetical protein